MGPIRAFPFNHAQTLQSRAETCTVCMSFDEFSKKLQELKDEYKRIHQKEALTLRELEDFLIKRKYRKGGRALKSLKGLAL